MPPKKDLNSDESTDDRNEAFAKLMQPHIVAKEMNFSRLQRLYDLAKKAQETPSVHAEFNARLKDLTSIRASFENSIKEIIHLKKLQLPEYAPSYREITAFDDLYYFICSVSDSLPSSANKRSENEMPTESKCKPRLPKLEIFHFDSKQENWPTFRDTFTTLIHENKDISNIEKFYYLLSAVSGPALTIVKSLKVTGDNYPIIWESLAKRYENKRLLANTYLDKLFNFRPLQTESISGLNVFLQTFQENVKALQLLNIRDLSSYVLFYLSLRNLDPITKRDFEKDMAQNEMPTFEKLMEFVENQVRVLEMSENKPVYLKSACNQNKSSASQSSQFQTKIKSINQKTTLSSAVNSSKCDDSKTLKNCVYCNKPKHSIYRCEEYGSLVPEQRLLKIRQLHLCENCLRDNHTVSDCPSKIRCAVCKQCHHHTLHIDSGASTNVDAVALTCSANSTVLLGTAMIHVADCWGNYHTVRAIIDSGAMSSYITQDCVTRLGLTRRKCNFQSVGLGGYPVRNFGLSTCSIKPRDCAGPVLKTDSVIVTSIAGNLPTMPVSRKIFNNFQNLNLADPNFYKPGPIDILLAGDLFPYIYTSEKVIPSDDDLPAALNSIFGFVIAGQASLECNSNNIDKSLTTTDEINSFCTFSMNLDDIMRSFWEVENIPLMKSENPDDILADKMFSEQCRRDENGRYVVQYPFKPCHELGDSTALATRRFYNLESKLDRQPELKSQYHQFMKEYDDLGHMTCLGNIQDVDSKYIIPHFCILKPSSTTTSLRVVFDASSKTSNNLSLNSIVLPGRKLQADINEILINFRLRSICLSADICKMYRQIIIDLNQRPYQHILWRYSADQPIQVYELNTVTYGVASSPYLAIKVLHTLADDEETRFPDASKILKRAFFMDDFLWSVDTYDEAVQVQDELTKLLESGGFMLRKWSSNCPGILERLPANQRETPLNFDDGKTLSIKVLGLQWLPSSDAFSFSTGPINSVVTKRAVLSQIGRLFDPLGFVAPCIFYAKCLMQKLWSHQLDWDESLPHELESQWLEYVNELPLLSQFKHERHATVKNHNTVQLIGFCDASTLGICAAVYLRSSNKSEIKVSLILAKSKVSPLKTISIPRLELMAAHLLAKLVKYSCSILSDIKIDNIYLFTDSSVVLAWINTPPHTLKTFVATRVSKITECVSSDTWYHVNGDRNPADLGSRGALPSALLSSQEWLHGPSWLKQEHTTWPIRTVHEFKDQNPPELKVSNVILISTENNMIYGLTEKFSSLSKLINVVARCFQFVHNCSVSKSERRSLSILDINKAHQALILIVQRHHFSSDIEALKKGNHCSQSLRKLNPFIASDSSLRVGGRLAQSSLPYGKKHPIVLPKKSAFTNLIIDHYHKSYLHVGPRTLQSLLNQKYWIIASRSAIRSKLSKCISCFKVSPKKHQPEMGQLPQFRSDNIHAFHTVGVDIGGPFETKESNRRNARICKSYLCAFVCCATRAVHLEVLSSLSTECFMACFDRFTARRGLCHTVISDNGGNFVSAGKQLQEVTKFLNSQCNELSNGFTVRKIHWKYNPPTGSHFGGIFESVIKQAKLHPKRVIGTRALSFEELGTLFARVEAVLNSRPLSDISSDSNEFEVLTPSHFLIGRELLSIPEYELSDVSTNRLQRWQVLKQISQNFWRLWKRDYLHTLQQRHKWLSNTRNLKVGELVLMHSDAPPLNWALARVTKTHPGPDGVVRVVTVRTKNKEFVRPVVKLSPLPIEDTTNKFSVIKFI